MLFIRSIRSLSSHPWCHSQPSFLLHVFSTHSPQRPPGSLTGPSVPNVSSVILKWLHSLLHAKTHGTLSALVDAEARPQLCVPSDPSTSPNVSYCLDPPWHYPKELWDGIFHVCIITPCLTHGERLALWSLARQQIQQPNPELPLLWGGQPHKQDMPSSTHQLWVWCR